MLRCVQTDGRLLGFTHNPLHQVWYLEKNPTVSIQWKSLNFYKLLDSSGDPHLNSRWPQKGPQPQGWEPLMHFKQWGNIYPSTPRLHADLWVAARVFEGFFVEDFL